MKKTKNKLIEFWKNNHKTIFVFVLFLLILYGFYTYSEQNKVVYETAGSAVENTQITIPVTDITFDIRSSSLLVAALVIGLLDGFNPCAMWVLIYLITLVSGLQDRKKMWFVVGTFLLASGILYFIILAGWLNLFAVIGYSKWILFAVGAFAIWTGLYAIYDFQKKGGKLVCEVGDIKSRKKTMNKIKDIVHSPITIASVFAAIILAFAINSIEFVCSAGLPAIFTQMLAIADVSLLAKYGYITVYVLAFMFDDLLIFTLALMAINSDLMEKYSGFSKLIGGIIMIAIGIVLLFFPEWLAGI